MMAPPWGIRRLILHPRIISRRLERELTTFDTTTFVMRHPERVPSLPFVGEEYLAIEARPDVNRYAYKLVPDMLVCRF
jgi:hypothetical protein